MTLREEVAALETKALQSHIVHPQTAYRQAIYDVLAIIDKREAKSFGDLVEPKPLAPECALCESGVLVAHDPRDKEPSEEQLRAHSRRCLDPEHCVDDPPAPHESWRGCFENAKREPLPSDERPLSRSRPNAPTFIRNAHKMRIRIANGKIIDLAELRRRDKTAMTNFWTLEEKEALLDALEAAIMKPRLEDENISRTYAAGYNDFKGELHELLGVVGDDAVSQYENKRDNQLALTLAGATCNCNAIATISSPEYDRLTIRTHEVWCRSNDVHR